MKVSIRQVSDRYSNYYDIDSIVTIRTGKARRLLEKSDLEGNGVPINETVTIVSFCSGQTATFIGDCVISYID